MPEGPCGLCLKTRELQDSHYLPRAFYKRLRGPAEERNPNPVVVTEAGKVATSKQVTDYLLCADCEDRFNRNGEKRVIENCWQAEGRFPILAALTAATPVHSGEAGFRAFEGRSIKGIDADQLGYFAASVFWRAAVRQWSPIGEHSSARLDLGAYAEELRLFLLGEAGFPTDVVLSVNVNASTTILANEYAVLPFLKARRADCDQYKLLIPGLGFEMFVGKDIPAGVRAMCLIRSPQGFLFTSDRMEEATLVELAKLVLPHLRN
jgi:hypothetical protein